MMNNNGLNTLSGGIPLTACIMVERSPFTATFVFGQEENLNSQLIPCMLTVAILCITQHMNPTLFKRKSIDQKFVKLSNLYGN